MTKYLLLVLLISLNTFAENSVCYGTSSNGSLKNGVELPAKGTNFVAYSSVARAMGRTYVHSGVRDIVVAAYVELEKIAAKKVYKYAETGYEYGGQFKPHKTHRNGLSVDFMTPVIDGEGNSVHLPTHPFNKFGYNIEFDNNDQYNAMRIDYDALAAHIVALHQQAKVLGHDLWRVIFAPELQPNLFKTQYVDYLTKNINF